MNWKLRPCLLCGKKGRLVRINIQEDHFYNVMCSYCINQTKLFDTKEEAVKAWNGEEK